MNIEQPKKQDLHGWKLEWYLTDVALQAALILSKPKQQERDEVENAK